MGDDMRRILGDAVGTFDPAADAALAETTRRGRRKAGMRKVLASAIALGLSGALFGTLWMSFRPGRVTQPVGPTPGPTVSVNEESQSFLPPLGKADCAHPQWADSEICTGRSGPVVVLASGEANEGPWTLSAYRGVYDGPEPGVKPGVPAERVVRGVICISFAYVEPASTFCEGSDEPGSSWAFDLGSRDDYDRPLAEDPGDDPFPFDRGGVYGGTSKHENWAVGTTSSETARVVANLDDGRAMPIPLFRSDPRLGTSVKWWVAFFPIDARHVTTSAEDVNGETLWEQDRELLQRLFIEKVGGGSGAVKGYWTNELEAPARHDPHPWINCGPECWYAFISNPPSYPFTLLAEPEAGSRFAGWGGPCEGQPATCEIPLRETQTVTAIFEPVES